MDSIKKGRSLKFRVCSRVRQTPEEDRKTYRPKRCGNNNKDEDNSPKILNDKNHQASSLKFRQIYIFISKCCGFFHSSRRYSTSSLSYQVEYYTSKKDINNNYLLVKSTILKPRNQYMSSSSCRAGSTDIPDPLSQLLPIVHRPRQVFRTTSCILT